MRRGQDTRWERMERHVRRRDHRGSGQPMKRCRDHRRRYIRRRTRAIVIHCRMERRGMQRSRLSTSRIRGLLFSRCLGAVQVRSVRSKAPHRFIALFPSTHAVLRVQLALVFVLSTAVFIAEVVRLARGLQRAFVVAFARLVQAFASIAWTLLGRPSCAHGHRPLAITRRSRQRGRGSEHGCTGSYGPAGRAGRVGMGDSRRWSLLTAVKTADADGRRRRSRR